MTKLLRAVENLKQQYIEKLLEAGVFNNVEKSTFSYTVKELEELLKQVNQS
jgi:hypothetical protein